MKLKSLLVSTYYLKVISWPSNNLNVSLAKRASVDCKLLQDTVTIPVFVENRSS